MTSPYPTVVTVCAAHQTDSPNVSNSPWARTRTAVAASSVISKRHAGEVREDATGDDGAIDPGQPAFREQLHPRLVLAPRAVFLPA